MKKRHFWLFVLTILLIVLTLIFKPYKSTKSYYVKLGAERNQYKLVESIEQNIYSDIDVVNGIIIPAYVTNEKDDKKEDVFFDKFDNKSILYDLHLIEKKPYVKIKILDEYDNEVYNKSITFDKIDEKSEIHIDGIVFKDYKWKKLSVQLNCMNCTNKDYVMLDYYKTDSDNTLTGIQYEDEETKYTLDYNLNGRKEAYTFFWIAILLFFFINSIYYLKNIGLYNKFRMFIESFSTKKTYYIFYFLISLITAVSLLKILVSTFYYNQLSNIWLVVFLFFALLLIFNILSGIKNVEAHKLYLILAIPISIFYCIFLLPNYVADENHHYYKAYNVSNGVMSTKSNSYIPVDMYNVSYKKIEVDTYKKLFEQIDEKTDYNNLIKIEGRANNYSSLLYIPSAIGINIARSLNINMFIGYYLARLLNLIVSLVIGYYCIKKIPYRKIILLVYLLNPMYIHQCISISADSITNSVCISFITYLLYLKDKYKNIKNIRFINYALIVFLGYVLIKAKMVYAPLLLLILSLFNIGNTINFKKMKKLCLIFLSILLIFIFVMGNMSIGVGYTFGQTITINNTLLYIYDYFLIFVRTLYNNLYMYINSFAGSYLGWLHINVEIFGIAYIVILILSLSITSNDKFITKKDKFLFILISLIIFNLIFYGFYIVYPSESSSVIYGVQGRYFIPFLILPLLLIKIRKNIISKDVIIYSLIFIHFNIIMNIIFAFG